MALLKKFILIPLLASALCAVAVESETDQPLDLRQGWSFLRAENFYLQHQCSAARAKTTLALLQSLPDKLAALLGTRELSLPLQVRLLASAPVYRRTMRFSQNREGHFNPRLNMLVTHCSAPARLIEEQFVLFYLKESGLRPWQKIFVAETTPYVLRAAVPPVIAEMKKQPAPALIAVLLSNHTPGKAERITLGRLSQLLYREKKLSDFLTGLAQDTENSDDTALELLETLIPGIADDIVKGRIFAERSPNNTLRN